MFFKLYNLDQHLVAVPAYILIQACVNCLRFEGHTRRDIIVL